jgi:glycogen phosphorylase
MQIPKIGFISMEFGINSKMNTYCGGLGILSGDIIKSCTDMEVKMTGFSILYKKGWFKQKIDDNGYQVIEDDIWDYNALLIDTQKHFKIVIKNVITEVKIWEYKVKSSVNNFENSIYFLDVDIEGNDPIIRQCSNNIYSTNKDIFYCQQVLLSLGIVELEKELDLNIDIYHLNESHAVFHILNLLSKYNENEVKSKMVFTSHTPLETAHQKFNLDILKQYISKDLVKKIPASLIQNNEINLTKLALYYSKFSNAVAKRHEEVSDKMYPEFQLDHVTNGVHAETWACSGLGEIFDKYINGWRQDPYLLRQVGVIPDEILEESHMKNKINLCNHVNALYDKGLDPNVFTIGFARRTVGYKRANMILTEMDRLKNISKKFGKLQIIFAGKAYPTDKEGIELIKSLLDACKMQDNNLKIAFIENYNMDIAKKMVLGVDLWLNNPIPPLEASGTSGMKASLNGIPNFSILDGWWVEGHIEGITGWSIGQDLCVGDFCQLIEIEDLYAKLENQIFNAWNDKKQWSLIRKSCIALNGPYFNTHRVVQEYILKAYLK